MTFHWRVLLLSLLSFTLNLIILTILYNNSLSVCLSSLKGLYQYSWNFLWSFALDPYKYFSWFLQKGFLIPYVASISKRMKSAPFLNSLSRVHKREPFFVILTVFSLVSCEAGSENFWTVPCLDGHKIGLSDVVYIYN